METCQSEFYYIVKHNYTPRIFSPKDYICPRGFRGPPSDVPNSEYSEKALGDSERYPDLEDMDYPSDEADTGEEPEVEIRPATKNLNKSSDTSMGDNEKTGNISAAIHCPPRNETIYLQVLLSGETRIIRKPGILPMVCYVDASTSTSGRETETKTETPTEHATSKDVGRVGLGLDELMLSLRFAGKSST
ncbi:uncharacterized protein LY89DRAFT_727247 [Mollisia scopiformis]|uniref:Uncharacterized protein n=1 Tax=Mollisia scopiformis TaxID=149040 RepID=A0A194XWU7_MOLSC|nr:uncharacterized protein LY89DRAFT_727247 [Mollisia scopiformis]KUJ24217.1 hypothetical protein LY89DRAFT_727247 [Mollisia scopiformis]